MCKRYFYLFFNFFKKTISQVTLFVNPLFKHFMPSIFADFLPRWQKNIMCTCFLRRTTQQTSSLMSTGDSSLSLFPCCSFQNIDFLKNLYTPPDFIQKGAFCLFLSPFFCLLCHTTDHIFINKKKKREMSLKWRFLTAAIVLIEQFWLTDISWVPQLILEVQCDTRHSSARGCQCTLLCWKWKNKLVPCFLPKCS